MYLLGLLNTRCATLIHNLTQIVHRARILKMPPPPQDPTVVPPLRATPAVRPLPHRARLQLPPLSQRGRRRCRCWILRRDRRYVWEGEKLKRAGELIGRNVEMTDRCEARGHVGTVPHMDVCAFQSPCSSRLGGGERRVAWRWAFCSHPVRVSHRVILRWP